MRTIYVDSNFKCHVAKADGMTAVETDYFDGKCDAYIEGYCHKDGMFYPWKPSEELDNLQSEYERNRMADMENALAILLGGDSV